MYKEDLALNNLQLWIHQKIATNQSAGAVEYIDCFSAERRDSPNECPGYDTKQFG